MGLITPAQSGLCQMRQIENKNTRLSVLWLGGSAMSRACLKALHRLCAGYQLPVTNAGNIGGYLITKDGVET